MKNAYAKEQAELRRQLLNYGALVGQQFNVDMMCLALNEEGFGHDRIMRIIHRAEKHGEYFHECLAYGVESDARFEQLDQRLRYICRDHPEDFVPREERYAARAAALADGSLSHAVLYYDLCEEFARVLCELRRQPIIEGDMTGAVAGMVGSVYG